MVHLYKNNGYNMVLDVNSGSIHVVDDVVYDVLELLNEAEDRRKEEGFRQEITDKMLAKYGEDITAEDMKDVFEDLDELEENGTLFTVDVYKEGVIDFKKRQTVVKALCLHIAHDCNLACRYCFAGEGEYKGDRSLMSLEVGQFRKPSQPGSRFLWRRAIDELRCSKRTGSLWTGTGENP